jgi:hypothetical protein
MCASPKSADYHENTGIMSDCTILLFFYTSEDPIFSSIPVVTFYGAVRSAGQDYGKKA